jgi:hypothetical protein
MNFTNTDTKILLKTWSNLKKGLDAIAKTIDNGTFNTAGEKGGAPPAQSGQTTLWFALAVDQELNRRGVDH